jgi:glycosyltransferase involved in cell wall biosynthesis
MIALLFTTDKVLVCSSYVRNKFFLVKHKSTLLFLGLGEEYFSPKYPVPQIGNKIIVFAGQFRKGKNQHVLIKAVARYIQTTKDSDLRLILPGSGPLLDACKQLVKKLNVEGIVTFPGQLTNTEVFNLYQICNMAVVPSNTETFGHCIAEPFALGYCVFTRKTGIAGDIIKDKYSGLFFDSENDLYNLFREYLPYPEKLSFIGKNAFENRDSLRFSKIALHYKSILDGMVVKD